MSKKKTTNKPLNSAELRDLVVNAMEDLKAQDIQVLDVSKQSDVADFMVIASGSSSRQVSAIADNVIEDSKKQGMRPLGSEGKETGEWVLVDLGDVIAHVMQTSVREFYQLEKLWSGLEPIEQKSHA
jgi:ribosome-associated protein